MSHDNHTAVGFDGPPLGASSPAPSEPGAQGLPQSPSGYSICVYCGAAPGHDPHYARLAYNFGRALGQAGIRLVYGGGSSGLMGQVGRGCREAGGVTIGIIPQALFNRELGDREASRLIVVETMHQRKQQMADLSQAFVALPGGIGTLEELFEVLTWAQLGYHNKPVGLLDVANYYEGLIDFLRHAESQGFLRVPAGALFVRDSDPQRLIEALLSA